MHFDVETLYELHYQMITLGKVNPLNLTSLSEQRPAKLQINVLNDMLGTF